MDARTLSSLPYDKGVLVINRQNDIITSKPKSLLSSLVKQIMSYRGILLLSFALAILDFGVFSSCFAQIAFVSLFLLSYLFIDTSFRQPRRSIAAAPAALKESDLAEINVANCRLQVRSVRLLEAKKSPLFQITITHKAHRWHSWRSPADVNLVVKTLKRDFPTLPLKAVDIPSSHTEDAAILRLMQKQIIDTLHAIAEITLICNHVEIRALLDLPLYKYSDRYGLVLTNTHFLKPSKHGIKPKKHILTPIPAVPTALLPPTPTAASDKAPAKITPKCGFRGDSWEDFEFTDISAPARSMFRDAGSTQAFKVRGKNYMVDQKKVLAGPALCRLLCMELYEVTKEEGDRHDHIASKGRVRHQVEALGELANPPFLFILNLQIPGDPPVSIVAIFAAPPEYHPNNCSDVDDDPFKKLWFEYLNLPKNEIERLAKWGINVTDDSVTSTAANTPVECDPKTSCVSGTTPTVESSETGDKTPVSASTTANASPIPLSRLTAVEAAELAVAAGHVPWRLPSDVTWPNPLDKGTLPSSDFRNQRFKLIPQITEGPWVVQAAVRSKPALLGQKVVQRYYRGENYIETDVYVGSSIIAMQIVGLCRGYAKHFACDIGEDASELPEKMLACLTLNKIDVEVRRKLQ